jgi:hypothetical protein
MRLKRWRSRVRSVRWQVPLSLVAVAIIVVLITTVAHASTLFSDDFETCDLTAWTGTTVDGGNSLSADAAAAKNGTCGMDAVRTAGQSASAYVSVTSSTTVYQRFWFELVSVTGTGTEYWISSDSNASGGMASGIQTLLGFKNGTGGASTNTWEYFTQTGWHSSGTSFSTGTWYCVEASIVHDASVGTVDMWVDGSNIVHATGQNTGGATTYYKLGARFAASGEAYFDDVFVDNTTTTTQGCGAAPTPTPTDTPTPTPTPTPPPTPTPTPTPTPAPAQQVYVNVADLVLLPSWQITDNGG